MGGGLGGKQTTETKLPGYITDASKENLAFANQVADIGYTPYRGAEIAAFSPMQQGAFMNTNAGADAFGFATPQSSGIPQSTNFGSGMHGYSSAPMYDQALQMLGQADPEQKAKLDGIFGKLSGQGAQQQSSGSNNGERSPWDMVVYAKTGRWPT